MKNKRLIDLFVKIFDKTAMPVFFAAVCAILFKEELAKFEYAKYIWYIIGIVCILCMPGLIVATMRYYRKK